MTNKLQRDGFQLLWIITYRNSPQLGGHARDLQNYVETLNAVDGEEITEFYERTLVMLNEIELQEDSTGQSNRLTNRFVTILSEFVDLRPCLRDVTKELTKFFRKKDHHKTTFHRTIQEIYEDEIEVADVPSMLLFSNKIRQQNNHGTELPDPKVNASKFNKNDK